MLQGVLKSTVISKSVYRNINIFSTKKYKQAVLHYQVSKDISKSSFQHSCYLSMLDDLMTFLHTRPRNNKSLTASDFREFCRDCLLNDRSISKGKGNGRVDLLRFLDDLYKEFIPEDIISIKLNLSSKFYKLSFQCKNKAGSKTSLTFDLHNSYFTLRKFEARDPKMFNPQYYSWSRTEGWYPAAKKSTRDMDFAHIHF